MANKVILMRFLPLPSLYKHFDVAINGGNKRAAKGVFTAVYSTFFFQRDLGLFD